MRKPISFLLTFAAFAFCISCSNHNRLTKKDYTITEIQSLISQDWYYEGTLKDASAYKDFGLLREHRAFLHLDETGYAKIAVMILLPVETFPQVTQESPLFHNGQLHPTIEGKWRLNTEAKADDDGAWQLLITSPELTSELLFYINARDDEVYLSYIIDEENDRGLDFDSVAIFPFARPESKEAPQIDTNSHE